MAYAGTNAAVIYANATEAYSYVDTFILSTASGIQTLVKVTATRLRTGKSNKCNFMKEKDVGKCSLKTV